MLAYVCAGRCKPNPRTSSLTPFKGPCILDMVVSGRLEVHHKRTIGVIDKR